MTDEGQNSDREVLDLGHRPELKPMAGEAHVEPPKAERKADHAPPKVGDGGTPVPGTTLSEEELDQLSGEIVKALKTVYDPEIPADIYELGLIYKIDVDDDRNVEIDMTLTAPGCPVAGEMPIWVQNAVEAVAGIQACKVNLVFDPPWDQSRMSDEARLAVGMF
jgi:FeS assembly SUF system protein